MEPSLKIEFFPSVTSDIKAKDGLNKKIVHEVIDKFENESLILKKQKILLYFGAFSSYIPRLKKALGTVKVRGTDEYDEFIKEVINHESRNKMDNLEDFKYLVYLSSDIRKCDKKKYKIFTIAHEFQHVLQFLEYPCTCLRKKHKVLFWYFDLKTLPCFKLLMEYDAIRKAKLINYRIFGKGDVDNFIDKKINRSREDTEKLYWENVKSIDLDIEYNLENGVKEFWERYKSEIDEEAKRLSGKVKHKENERAFLNAYNNY
ncbi:MAG: hypothetical protein ACFFA5_06490 [Promethearchaeota archaeon]